MSGGQDEQVAGVCVTAASRLQRPANWRANERLNRERHVEVGSKIGRRLRPATSSSRREECCALFVDDVPSCDQQRNSSPRTRRPCQTAPVPSCKTTNKRHEQMRARNLNCANQHDGREQQRRQQQRANDNQMLWAGQAESIRLLVSRNSSIEAGRDGGTRGKTRKEQEQTEPKQQLERDRRGQRIKLIGQQRASGLEFIRSSGSSSSRRRLLHRSPLALTSLFVLCLVVMQIITILPSCLIIYHATDCGLNAGRGAVSALGFVGVAAELATDDDGEVPPPAIKTANQKIYVRVGILLEESNHEQANMFIRTIKMINDQKDETIRQLLNMFAAAKRDANSANYAAESWAERARMQTTPPRNKTNPSRDEGLTGARLRRDGEAKTPPVANSNGEPSGPGTRLGSEIKSTQHRGLSNVADGASSGLAQQLNENNDRLQRSNRLLEEGGPFQQAAPTTRVNLETTNKPGPMRRATAIASSDELGRVSAYPTLGPIKHESHPDWQVAANTSASGKIGKPIKIRAVDDGEPVTGPFGGHLQQLSFDIELEPMIEFLQDRQSALEADEKICQLIESGVYAIFGPIDGRSIQHVQSICDNLEIPYFELRPFVGGSGSGSSTSSSGLGGGSVMPDSIATPSSQLQVPLPSSLVRPSPGTKPDHVGDDNDDDGDKLANETGEPDSQSDDVDNDESIKVQPDFSGSPDHNLQTARNFTAVHKKPAANSRRQAMANGDGGYYSHLTNRQPIMDHARHQMNSQVTPLANKLEALTLNLYPPSNLLNSAYIDLIYALNWTSFAIVYEDSASMIKLQNIFKESSPVNSWTNRWRIRLFRHDPDGVYGEYADFSGRTSNHDETLNSRKDNYFGANHRNGAGDSSRVSVATGASGNSGGKTVLAAPNSIGAPSPGTNSLTRNVSESSFLPRGNNQYYSNQPRPIRDSDNDQHGESSLLQQASRNNQPLPGRDGGNGKKNGGGTYRDVFWRVKLSGEHNILLDLKTENLQEALKQAQQVGCMTEEYSYLITSLDLHTIDLEDFRYSRTKITGFSLTQVTRNRPVDGPPNAPTNERIPSFDEKYLENLGVYLIQQMSELATTPAASSQKGRERQHQQRNASKLKSQRQQTLNGDNNMRYGSNNRDKAHAFDWINEAENNDQTRREMLQSSPASLGLLPTIDRNNEQKLFDFFLEQQERNVSRVRLSTSSAIIHDSLILYMLGLNEMDPSGKFLKDDSRQGQPIYCSLESQPWLHGSSLVNYMKQMTFNGLTGFVSFDQRGLRSDFKLDVLGMAPNIRLVKIGEWHSKYANEEFKAKFSAQNVQPIPSIKTKTKSGSSTTTNTNTDQRFESSGTLSVTTSDFDAHEDSKSYEELSSRYENELMLYNQMLARGEQVHVPYKKRVSPNGALLVNNIIFERLYREQADKIDTLIVTAKLSQPYFMLRETPSKLDGNDQFEGYAVDLIHELSKLVNFKYKWREVADKKYGSKEVLSNGTIVWNGMIGEIVRGTADLAIVDLTITAQREEAVDFTLPFMNTGISILFKKPTTKVTTLFSFLSPFSSDVWAYVLAAYCGISAILFLVGHLSPYEWADPHPCRHLNPDSDETVLKNQFSLLNSFWFTIGSLMQQGSDLTPRSMSTRTIAGIWYFFTLIMISSYTANLAAFLTVEKVVYPIENVRDLSNQQEIKYGCVESGSTCLFFHDSQIDTYKKIDETMRRHHTYVRSNDEGQKRVGEGKFAFFMESTTIEYIIERNCNLTQIGGLLDSKGYGIALAKKSRHKRPYRTLLNEGILHLQETGMLHVLKNRWWKEKRGGGTCTDDGKGGGVTELSLANVGGVFVVLLGGLGISFLVAIAEFIWRARRGGSSRDRMCEEMMNDLKFALACKSSTKPIQRVSGNGKNGTSTGSMRQRFARGAQDDRHDDGGRGGGPNGFTGDFYQHNSTASRLSKYMTGADESSSSLRAADITATGKRCNPILLHAMLTMLSSDQPHENNAPLPSNTSQRYGVPASLNPMANSIAGPFSIGATNSATQAHQQQQHFRTTDAGHLISYNGSGPESEFADDNDNDVSDDYDGCDQNDKSFDEEDSYSNMHQDRMLNVRTAPSVSTGGQYLMTTNVGKDRAGASDLSDISRRRMLHGQKTIDID